MYLFIDSSGDKVLRLAVSNDAVAWQEFLLPCEAAGDVLPLIDQTITRAGSTIGELSGIAVVVGKGRFTSTRVAVTIANTLAYALQASVIGLTNSTLGDLREQFIKTPLGRYVLAMYSAPPRIGGVAATV